MLHSFLYNSFNVATNSFILIVLSGFYLAYKRYAFFALKWETSSQASKPSERISSNFCTFSMSHHSSLPFPHSPSMFSPHLLPVEHSNLALLLLRLFGFSFLNRIIRRGGLRYASNSTWSSRGRNGRLISTHWCWQVFRYHFYRVFYLSTINVVPIRIPRTPMLSLLLHDQHNQNFKSQAPLNTPLSRVSRTKTDRNRNTSSYTTS